MKGFYLQEDYEVGSHGDEFNNIVIFIGPPGAGKGSLSNLCTENLNWVQLSTGNLCRKHIAEQQI